MVVGFFFEHPCDTQEFILGKCRGQDLQADGQIVFVKARWDAYPGNTRQVRCYRIDVGQVHLQRVCGLFACLKSGRRRNGHH